uniref:Uncharacterized protein n=1 Tax=viral metagenome TaxID=1070528 RepID=A0A6M3LC14_9ZZZZ
MATKYIVEVPAGIDKRRLERIIMSALWKTQRDRVTREATRRLIEVYEREFNEFCSNVSNEMPHPEVNITQA